jgi:ribonucleoside-diphosphate reductase alpha chain
MLDQKVPGYAIPSGFIFEFPIEAPKGAITTADFKAMDQLKLWQIYKDHYTDHNPSTTIYVREDEWLDVGAYVYRNFDRVGGLSFFPLDNHIYENAPYAAIDKATYEQRDSVMPDIDFTKFVEFTDGTNPSQERACAGGACDL